MSLTVDAHDTPATGFQIDRGHLHASLTDPVMDTMNFLNEITHRHPDAISFAPGRPYDGFFDTDDIVGYLQRYLAHLSAGGASPAQIRDAMFQYGPTSGQIRPIIADWLRRAENIDVPAASIVVTVGAQEAMLLTLRALFAGPDDVLLVSTPCYVGITGAAKILDIAVRGVAEPVDDSWDHLEEVIRAEHRRGRRPRAFYVMTDHANPTGATVSLAAREALLDLAVRYDLILLEDSPYRFVSPGRQLATLKSLDERGVVVHVGSFSKTLFPGARVGFVIADQPVRGGGILADEISKIKSMVTVNTASLSQAAVAGMLLDYDTTTLGRTVTTEHYERAMSATVEALELAFPAHDPATPDVTWNHPGGGFFLVLDVDFRADNAALARSAEDHRVIWTPMSYFYPDGGGERAIRLSTSYLSVPDITEGVTRLARFVQAETRALT